jgi:hypothetical protein
VYCAELTERLLAEELEVDSDLSEHVADCPRCARITKGLARLDSIVAASLIVVPPLELQWQLNRLAMEGALPRLTPWWSRVPATLVQVNPAEWLTQRPQTIAAQGLAAVLLALASWQVFAWLSTFQPVVGDVAYAMELVAASPAVTYIGSIQIDFQSLGLWSAVAVGGWLISDNGLIGRRLASAGLQLP